MCCARERMTEFACPESCDYLNAARAQTAEREAELRAREREAGVVYPELPEEWIALAAVAEKAIVETYRFPERSEVAKLTNAEIAAAMRNAVANLQTRESGLIYEHAAASHRIEDLSLRVREALMEAVMEAVRGGPPDRRPGGRDLINVLQYHRAAAEGHMRRGEDEFSYLRYMALYVAWPEEDSAPLIVLK